MKKKYQIIFIPLLIILLVSGCSTFNAERSTYIVWTECDYCGKEIQKMTFNFVDAETTGNDIWGYILTLGIYQPVESGTFLNEIRISKDIFTHDECKKYFADHSNPAYYYEGYRFCSLKCINQYKASKNFDYKKYQMNDY